MSRIGSLTKPSLSLFGNGMLSNISNKVPFLYQSHRSFDKGSFIFKFLKPEIGTHLTLFFTSNPTVSRNLPISDYIYVNLSKDQFSVSILFINTARCLTPKLNTN